MKCYNCQSTLSALDYCGGCGADVRVYKKIVQLSNAYYNMGLQKANIRDLSGAAELLRRSLELYKGNTQARNLLGLVYYEMGEIVMALKEWVISQNLDRNNNLADVFIRDIQSNQNRLDTLNQSVRKYNISLGYAMEGKYDVAIIQLKKVLNMNDKFIKAYQLLALVYMKKEEYDKAKRILYKSLAVDKYNTLTIKYIEELKTITGVTDKIFKKEQEKERKKEEKKKVQQANEVIIPKSTYKEVNYGLMTFLYVVIGIILGAALVYFLVTPAKVSDAKNSQKDVVKDYMEDVAKLNIDIGNLETQIAALTAEKESISAALQEQQAKTDYSDTYNQLLEALALYVGGNVTGCADKLTTITVAEGMAAQFTTLFEQMKTLTYEKAVQEHINNGSRLSNSNKWDEALTHLLLAEKMQPENVSCLYYIGKCYYEKNGGKADENSNKYFEKVVALAPGSDYANWSQWKIQK